MEQAHRTPSGNWKIKVYAYKDSEGKQHCKTFTADTKKEAERLARQYKYGVADKASADITVSEAVQERSIRRPGYGMERAGCHRLVNGLRGADMMTESMKKAQAKYEQKVVRVTIKLIKGQDDDLIQILSARGNKQGYIKDLIRKYA